MARNGTDTERKACGAYLGLAIGDALGATVEFMTPGEIREQFGVHDRVRGEGWLRLQAGQVTDDTQMSLALGQALIASGRINAHDIAEAFSAWMRDSPVDIGNTVRRGIVHYRHSGEPYMKPDAYAAGNGACMRILPVALATLGWPEQHIARACATQAHITHNNDVSDAAIACVVKMLHLILRGKNKTELRQGPVSDLIRRYPEFSYDGKAIANPSGYIVATLRVVFDGFFNEHGFRECLVKVVNTGGDADTTGAIAGMLAGCYYGIDALPEEWLSRLDTEVRRQCLQQARDLLALPIAMEADG